MSVCYLTVNTEIVPITWTRKRSCRADDSHENIENNIKNRAIDFYIHSTLNQLARAD